MKVKHITAILAALLFAVSLAACGRGNTAASMHLVKTEGKVQVDNAEGKSVKVAENLGLYSGYEVSTQAESYGWITLDDTKLAKTDELSDIEVRKKGEQLELYVRSGGLFFNVTEPLTDDESMDIRTSTMAVGIRGTCGWVEVESRNLMCVYLLKGTVDCTVFSEEGSVLTSETINAGQAARMVLDGDKASVTVAEFDTRKLPSFVEDALENPEDWGVSDAENLGFLGGEDTEDSKGTQADDSSGDESGAAVDANGDIIRGVHVREEDGILYFYGTGVIKGKVYEGYTPVNVVVEEGITGITMDVFSECDSLVSITLPASLELIDRGAAFSGCKNLVSVTMAGNLECIEDDTFRDCTSLTTVILPAGLKRIDSYAFSGCTNLTSITMPDGLESIGNSAFEWCTSLSSVILPDGLQSIGKSAFDGCKALTSITLPDGLKSIGDFAFRNCTALTSITLPASIESMGEKVFGAYGSLESVKAPSSLQDTVESWFSDYNYNMATWVFEWY